MSSNYTVSPDSTPSHLIKYRRLKSKGESLMELEETCMWPKKDRPDGLASCIFREIVRKMDFWRYKEIED